MSAKTLLLVMYFNHYCPFHAWRRHWSTLMDNVKAIDARRIGYVYKMPYRKVAIDCFAGELVLKVPINSVQASWSI